MFGYMTEIHTVEEAGTEPIEAEGVTTTTSISYFTVAIFTFNYHRS